MLPHRLAIEDHVRLAKTLKEVLEGIEHCCLYSATTEHKWSTKVAKRDLANVAQLRSLLAERYRQEGHEDECRKKYRLIDPYVTYLWQPGEVASTGRVGNRGDPWELRGVIRDAGAAEALLHTVWETVWTAYGTSSKEGRLCDKLLNPLFRAVSQDAMDAALRFEG